jgi:hypothetical protein
MFEPRQKFATPEHRRYAAECRRLAAIARPLAKPVGRKPAPSSRQHNSDLLGLLAAPFRAPKRQRKLATTVADR